MVLLRKHAFLCSFIQFSQQIFTECLPCARPCTGCWSYDGVWLTVQKVTSGPSPERGDGHGSGEIGVRTVLVGGTARARVPGWQGFHRHASGSTACVVLC